MTTATWKISLGWQWPFGFHPWFVLLTLGWTLGVGPGSIGAARADCLTPPGDVTGDSKTDIVDVQCLLLTSLWELTGKIDPLPTCLKVSVALADQNCSDSIDVTDVTIEILLAIGSPMSASIDANSDGCVDVCQDIGPPDQDKDGDPDATDCAPQDPGKSTLAPEICNGVDDDCDSLIDEDPASANASCGDTNACNGAETCVGIPTGQTVVINELLVNPKIVADTAGEWIELVNVSATPIELSGWSIGDDVNDSHVLMPPMPLFLNPGAHIILGRNGDPAVNGGVSVQYVYSNFALANDADKVILRNKNNQIVDSVAYGTATGWSVPNGATLALKYPGLDNNVASSWATSTQVFGAGDFGTPGKTNTDVFGGQCKAGTALVCNDNSVCTTDSCNPATGCVFAPNPAACNDNNPCTVDACSTAGTCTNTAKTCNDNNVCTTDSCDPVSGECSFVAKVCNDNNACTTDACGPTGACVFTAKTCTDGDSCTNDSCDAQTGACKFTAVMCNDGNACTADACVAGAGCTFSTLVCNDNNNCTTDSCNTATGCVFAAKNCNDLSACTTDSCNPATGCVNTPVLCNDNDACTTDSCVNSTGCAFTPMVCNDNNACTADSCAPLSGCTTTAVNCDDGNACTTDSCSPVSGCSNIPSVGAILSENFDGTAPGWTKSGAWGIGAAVATSSCSSSGCYGNAPGVDNTPGNANGIASLGGCVKLLAGAKGCLMSPPVNAASATELTLKYFSLTNDVGATVVDRKIEVLKGGTWNLVWRAPVVGACNSETTWKENSVDLLPWKSNGLQVRFCYEAYSSSTDAPRWRIDDVAIQYNDGSCDDGNACTAESCGAMGQCVHTPVQCGDGDPCTGVEVCSVSEGCVVAPDAGQKVGVLGVGGVPVNKTAALVGLWQAQGADAEVVSDVVVAPGSTYGILHVLLSSIDSLTAAQKTAIKTHLTAWTQAGGVLVVHSTRLNIGSATLNSDYTELLPTSTSGTVEMYKQSVADVMIPLGSVVAAGPGGAVGDTTLDGSSAQPAAAGYLWAMAAGSVSMVLMQSTAKDPHAVAVTWPSGAGRVYYSAMRLEAAMGATGAPYAAIVGQYFPNVAAWAKSVAKPTVCNDASACTADLCAGAVCSFVPQSCSDNNACTMDTCDGTLACKNETLVCPDDGSVCTTESCDPQTGCKTTPIVCNDNVACTVDSCLPATGCKYTQNDGACSDGDVCNGQEKCTGAGCVAAKVAKVLYGVSPVDTSYLNKVGSYVNGAGYSATAITNYTTVNYAAADMVFINIDGTAIGEFLDTKAQLETFVKQGGVLVVHSDRITSAGSPNDAALFLPGGAGIALAKSDTTDVSLGPGSEITTGPGGTITNSTLDGAPGFEGVATTSTLPTGAVAQLQKSSTQTLAFSYPYGKGWVYYGALPLSWIMSISVSCMTCGAFKGTYFSNVVDWAAKKSKADICNDANYCTDDLCDKVTGCDFGITNCDDGNACTFDSCSVAGGCAHTTVACDDGDACTKNQCHSASGCNFPPVNCDDGVACTDDECDFLIGCQNVPYNPACSDGNACNGAEVCSKTAGCSAAKRPQNGTVGFAVDTPFTGTAMADAAAIVDAAGLPGFAVTDWAQFGATKQDTVMVTLGSAMTISSALITAAPALQSFVNAGGTLVVHSNRVNSGGVSDSTLLLPGKPALQMVRDNGGTPEKGLNVLTAVTGLTTGPMGAVTNTNLDGAGPSSVGYVVDTSLPVGAVKLLVRDDNPAQVVAFTYPYGQGRVLYAAVGLEKLAAGQGVSPAQDVFADVWAPNTLLWAAIFAGQAGVCNDNDACTLDLCDAVTGACQHEPLSGPGCGN
ncbi:MAG: lamin tail domain-containing protein [Myxococcales bacterium]|nr:lamin tail domain-containing protein [Myxococcales bacterium]